MIHKIKSWPRFFQDVKSGVKTFEIRVNDRGYAVGDTLVLREWDPETGEYTGNKFYTIVRYLLELDEMFGTKNLVAMGIEPKIKDEETTEWNEIINPAYYKDWYRNYKYAVQCARCGHIVIGKRESATVQLLKECPACRCPIKGKEQGKVTEQDRGLYVKYHVTKIRDGKVVDGCFVLRPDIDPAAVEALRVYAKTTDNRMLAHDINVWMNNICGAGNSVKTDKP